MYLLPRCRNLGSSMLSTATSSGPMVLLETVKAPDDDDDLREEEAGPLPAEVEPNDPRSARFWESPDDEQQLAQSWPAPSVEDPSEAGSVVWRIRGLVRTIRPHQWVKNVFVLAPVVFATKLFDPVLLTNAGAAFAVFCLLAGAVYTLNDLADVDADRLHPVKRYRPIASGRVAESVAR